MKNFYYGLLMDKTLKQNTLDNVHTQLHPAFQMAVRDGVIRVNPTDGVMAEIKKNHIGEHEKCHALTILQQGALADITESYNAKETCCEIGEERSGSSSTFFQYTI